MVVNALTLTAYRHRGVTRWVGPRRLGPPHFLSACDESVSWRISGGQQCWNLWRLPLPRWQSLSASGWWSKPSTIENHSFPLSSGVKIARLGGSVQDGSQSSAINATKSAIARLQER